MKKGEVTADNAEIQLDLVHWEDPEGLGGEEGGRGDRDGEYMYIHG